MCVCKRETEIHRKKEKQTDKNTHLEIDCKNIQKKDSNKYIWQIDMQRPIDKSDRQDGHRDTDSQT